MYGGFKGLYMRCEEGFRWFVGLCVVGIKMGLKEELKGVYLVAMSSSGYSVQIRNVHEVGSK